MGLSATVKSRPQQRPPTTMALERGDRPYFHSRGDSATSDDSIQSSRPPRKASVPFVHSSHSSIATTGSSAFTKKAIVCFHSQRVQRWGQDSRPSSAPSVRLRVLAIQSVDFVSRSRTADITSRAGEPESAPSKATYPRFQ
jgi:hypothetical protein